MKVIVIEDELPARAKLESMLLKLDPQIIVLAHLGSVKESLQWLQHHHAPDLAFVDIQLSDSHSFDIFRRHPVSFPVIFTTAYDKYLLESFEFNSIDYLLKPVTEARLKRSLDKVKALAKHFLQDNVLQLIHSLNSTKGNSRIVVRKGTEFIAIEFADVAYFYTEHKIVFLRDFDGRQLIVDKNLAELGELVGHEKFFRINRKFLANLKAIDRFKPDHGKIRVFLQPEVKEEVHISKETAPEFRKWIGS